MASRVAPTTNKCSLHSQLAKDYQQNKKLMLDLRGVLEFDDKAIAVLADAGVHFSLDLGGTAVTGKGLDRLAQSCPGIQVRCLRRALHDLSPVAWSLSVCLFFATTRGISKRMGGCRPKIWRPSSIRL